MPSPILSMTPEERRELLARANAARASKPKPQLRSDFPYDTEAEWSRLAAEAGIRLPPYGVPCTTGRMATRLARLGIPVEAYLAWDGSKRLADWIRRNPQWPLKAWLGCVMEHRELIRAGCSPELPAPSVPAGNLGCECRACLALAARYTDDPGLLIFYRRRLLIKGWAGETDSVEKAYILAHAPWASTPASAETRLLARLGANSDRDL